MAKITKYKSWMLNSTFTKKGKTYRITGTRTMAWEEELIEGIAFTEMNTNKDVPLSFLWSEKEFFSKVAAAELRIN